MSTIQALNKCVWRGRVDVPTIEQWLREFGDDGQEGTRGRLHALYLLSRFTYFGDEEVRALLKSLYRDFYRYPIVMDIRQQAGDTRDEKTLRAGFKKVRSQTRFLAMGNPSESGTYLLYHYRQENRLTRKLFISPHEIFDLTRSEPALADPEIDRYIFIDDFCGSGVQGVRYSHALMPRIRDAATRAGVSPKVEYHVLIGTSKGLRQVKTEADFDDIAYVLKLDDSFRVFGDTSRYFRDPPEGIELEFALELVRRLGEQLSSKHPLGYKDGQLMLGFFHNTPNNTLPIFCHSGSKEKPWYPVFRRYYKFLTPVQNRRSE